MEQEEQTLMNRTLSFVLHYVGTLAQFVRLLIGLLMDDRVDKKVKIFVGSVLAYVFSPIDFIPELFSGLFGMLDDFVLSAFALNVILNWVDPEIVRSHWRGDTDLLQTIQKGIANAEILVPEAIVKKIRNWIDTHAQRALVPVRPVPETTPAPAPKKRRTKKQS